ncbi:alpha/beta hydrolase [Geothrix sp. PMB-07]|uniref:alpha/beta hydrolase n=1 Tax=Geothrix sp. PMB-07 TaxID=3068640 RepID=UPI0027421538|nr:prolyl oligopeptidase family serine peptidase [Geothrix sp. PMB-07]WLT32102.1 prolyl oligopeptidase family serine peptidase [Geothrix sp. PMB-07]
MRSRWIRLPLLVLAAWAVASVALGWWVLPGLLLNPPLPQRTEAQRASIRQMLQGKDGSFTSVRVPGGQGAPLELWHLRRAAPRGAVIYLHGFGDDVWGTLGRARSLPEWDAVGFTFRGRDRNPSTPCTMGGWERQDVVAAFRYLEAAGFPAERIVIAGWSMGAGVGLLALEDLEREGKRPGGALLECPFQDLHRAARDHIRGTLGHLEPLATLAERVALWASARQAHFDPASVSPLRSAERIGCRIALITGDADPETPVDGVRGIARFHPDLTIIHGAGHCEASNRFEGGWGGWAQSRIKTWGL